MERLLEGARHLGRLQHRHRPLGHRLGDRGDVDGLEVLLVQPGDRGLTGDAQDRDGVGAGRVEAGDHVGAGRTGGADADADVAGLGPGVALGHVRGALDVPGQHVLDAAVLAHRVVEGVDRRARQPERLGRALQLQDLHGGVDRAHLRHAPLTSLAREPLDAAEQRRVVQAAVALGPQRPDQLGGHRAQRDGHALGPGGVDDDAHVLVVQVDPEAGLELPGQHAGALAVHAPCCRPGRRPAPSGPPRCPPRTRAGRRWPRRPARSCRPRSAGWPP